MKRTSSFMRKQVCTAALSLALLPLAATAQTASTAGQNSTASTQSQSSQQASGGSATGAATASGAKQGATFVLIPVVSPLQDQWKRTGCWAKLHDNPGFTGDVLSLSGPLDMPDMVGPFGIDWKGKISSIETGANTTLTVYDNVNYRDPVSTFKPGERIADVSKRMGYFDQMRSLRITCTGAAAAGR